LSYQFQTALSNGSLKDNHASNSISVDQTTARLIRNVQEIGFAAHEALALGDVGTPGFACFINLDDTNFVEIGIDVAAAFHAFAKLKAGEQCVVRLGTAAPYAQADTAAVELFYIIYDD
jgi:pantothenate kinase type III